MPDINDLLDWLANVRETNAFLILLPSLVGVVLACIADWMEVHITSVGETAASQTQAHAPTRGPQHAQGAVAHLDQRQVPSRAS